METYILEMCNITKEFPGVKALDNVSFKVRPGEIHALCGENGAGKSTLMKVLSGVYPYGTYSGEIYINHQLQQFPNIRASEDAGIAIINQELSVIKQMTIGENIFLGNEPNRFGIIDWPQLYHLTSQYLEEVGLKLRPETKVSELGVGQQQLVEIAKALSKKAKILILDEPTAALTEAEVDTLMGILRRLKQAGVTCIYISHKLSEVLEIADSVTVLRDGKTIATKQVADTTENELISLMVGREISERFPRIEHQAGDIVLEVKNFTVYDPSNPLRPIIHNVNFSVRRGEILGIAGLMGAGRTELVSSIFGGFTGRNHGEIYIDGERVQIHSPEDAIRHGIALVTEDRKRHGLILEQEIRKNLTIVCLDKFCKYNVINFNEEIKECHQSVNNLRIKTPSLFTRVNNLSGGNQQKVVLGKWLMTTPKVLILDEPTRGIDVGAKFEIYNIMNELKKAGVAIIMVSSELPEVLGMSDRILVMHEGRFNGEFLHGEADQEKIMFAATGGN
ncbi:MAG TPA: xylose ABC transporter ATP-binding protein [Bacillota bacterium]|nr:xylose ABC transporter ATP-binding protein [Bacillota bacterium]HPT88313.1 xylose ABC transporter ATP-binding protein [Bacillota bacterium]